ncbi:MAG: hypothetical protein SOR58_08905 [Megasphaera massiliensis]|jgi:hypothetical protein|uniref:hypothetical protein n=1 Tax=Megasphaera TaxID=906 RepID=UPI002586C591|nr:MULTISPECIES: hypothetical protein [Megasphaera]MDY2966303.1 hypothetical protein [Megasphaera massiliensis]
MGLWDVVTDAKERMEKSRRAREYLKRAKELVKDGNDLYERAYNKTTSYADETEDRLRSHMHYKQKVARELGNTINVTLENFNSFDIDSRVMSAPSIKEPQMDLGSFQSTFSSCFPSPSIPSIFDRFISDEDYYEARAQLDEAKWYKSRMREEKARLYEYKERMGEIRSFISTEKYELDSLLEKLRKMTDELQESMKEDSFSADRAVYLKGIHKISSHIVTLLNTSFLGDKFAINQKYQEVFSAIQSINRNIPDKPSIGDSNLLNSIRQILDNDTIIVH